MKKFYLFHLLICIFIVSSCSSKKGIVYLQSDTDTALYTNNYEHLIIPGDILKITLKVDNPESQKMLTPTDAQGTIYNQSRESLIFKGIKVDAEGNINYPSVGQINVINSTTKDVEKNISSILTQKKIFINPVIDVKVVNMHFTILGEVNNPGRFFYDKENLNIFEAVGYASDLTINGKRDDVKLLRFENNKVVSNTIDLTKGSLIQSDFFQIKSGDVIIINPNYSRVKNAGIIGNSGTLLSLLSFLLSSIIVMQN